MILPLAVSCKFVQLNSGAKTATTLGIYNVEKCINSICGHRLTHC